METGRDVFKQTILTEQGYDMTTHAVTPAHSRMALTPHGTDNKKSLGAGISWATLVTIRTAARPQAGNLTLRSLTHEWVFREQVRSRRHVLHKPHHPNFRKSILIIVLTQHFITENNTTAKYCNYFPQRDTLNSSRNCSVNPAL